MRGPRLISPVLAAGLCAGLLVGCGSSSSDTISVANTFSATTNTTSAPTPSTVTTTTNVSTSSPTGTLGTPTAATTRTQNGPAFVQTTTSGGLSSGPAAVVVAHGYTPTSPSTYNPQNTLQVIIGEAAPGRQKAFFFVNGRYIGTDTVLPSSSISLVNQSDTEVTLSYALVHPDGSSAGSAPVTFALNNGALSPLGPIPPASPTAALSRR